MSERGLGLQLDRRMDEVLGAEVDQRSAQILGFGVKEAGHSLGRGEQQMKKWSYLCRQDHKHTPGDSCRGKDRDLLLYSVGQHVFRDVLNLRIALKLKSAHISPAGSHAVTHGWVVGVPQRVNLFLGVVVVVPAFVVVV